MKSFPSSFFRSKLFAVSCARVSRLLCGVAGRRQVHLFWHLLPLNTAEAGIVCILFVCSLWGDGERGQGWKEKRTWTWRSRSRTWSRTRISRWSPHPHPRRRRTTTTTREMTGTRPGPRRGTGARRGRAAGADRPTRRRRRNTCRGTETPRRGPFLRIPCWRCAVSCPFL